MLKRFILAAIAGTVVMTGPAFAHAKLQASVPAANAQVAAAPAALKLTFDEAVQLAALKLLSAGKETPVTVDRTAKAATLATVPLPALVPGKYDVQWTAVSADDGHVTKGSFSFTVSGAAPPSP